MKDYHGNHKPYNGRMLLAKWKNPIPAEELKTAISFGMDELTRPYDNWEIFRILLRVLFRIGRKERNRSYICSELIVECFKKIDIKFKKNNTYISPDEVAKDPKLQFIERIL